jgi:hypothetical protein
MRTFACESCGGSLYFENDTCLACGKQVGFRPDDLTMCAVEDAAASGLHPCRNWTEFAACNWLARADADSGYCESCSLNEVVPDLADLQRRALWIETERAKRRLIFTLLELGLPLRGAGDKRALRFRLLADERADTGEIDPPPEQPIYTGHDDGCLTVNVVEADDALREAMRKRLNERYRTMLGHLRHEIGHYYWYLLVDGSPRQEAARELFGDERKDYSAAMREYYGATANDAWAQRFVSQYATMHPWEDFAETWAHYIHIFDTLETASASSLTIGGRAIANSLPIGERPFAEMLADWLALSVGLNQLNRSMGMRDAYPFALTEPIIAKLEFVDEVCKRATAEGIPLTGASATAPSGGQRTATVN